MSSGTEKLMGLVEELGVGNDGDVLIPGVGSVGYFDAADGLYWFCSDYHGGQNSVLYSILSARLQYKPGPNEKNLYYTGEGTYDKDNIPPGYDESGEREQAQQVYNYLVDIYHGKGPGVADAIAEEILDKIQAAYDSVEH